MEYSNKIYKWHTPYEWLMDKASVANYTDVYDMLSLVAIKVDPDDIQAIFQPEMIQDGYFDPIEIK
jgi:hypothetical protein